MLQIGVVRAWAREFGQSGGWFQDANLAVFARLLFDLHPKPNDSIFTSEKWTRMSQFRKFIFLELVSSFVSEVS